MWGINTLVLNKQFSIEFNNEFNKRIQKYLISNDVINDGEYYKLTLKGKLFADAIASDLFV